MNETQRAAFLNAQVACMLAEMEAMKVENTVRLSLGLSVAWNESAFRALPDQYGLGHNAALTFLGGG